MTLSKDEKCRLISDFEKDVFDYLHKLRNTGKVHPYESHIYLVDRFSVSKKKASELLDIWLKNFREDETYRLIMVPKYNIKK